jgi:hypothetical protein
MSPLRLFGVAALDQGGAAAAAAGEQRALASGTQAVVFRDLAAVVCDTPTARPQMSPDEFTAYRRVIETVFAERAIVPAPAGVVFRTAEALVRWLELHYVTLGEALAFVEGRCCARVHVSRGLMTDNLPQGLGVERTTMEIGVDAETMAVATFRLLRRRAVAMVPLRPPRETGLFTASASFLLERDQWGEFATTVSEEARRDPELRFRLTGPWPPYDFVKMQFAG